MTIAGSIFYVITDPQDVSDVFSNSPDLSFDMFLMRTMLQFQATPSAVKKIFRRVDQKAVSNQHSRVANIPQIAHHLQVQQTSGNDLKNMATHIAALFRVDPCLESIEKSGMPLRVSLKMWTVRMFIDVLQDAYFGKALAEIDPDLSSALIEFDELSWQVFYPYPQYLKTSVNRLRDRIQLSMEAYLKLSPQQRQAKAWFTQGLIDEYSKVGLSQKDIATQLVFLYWG